MENLLSRGKGEEDRGPLGIGGKTEILKPKRSLEYIHLMMLWTGKH